MLDIYEACARAAENEPDAAAAAAKAFAELGCPKKWADVFLPIVQDECRRRYRSATKTLERSGSASHHLTEDQTPSAGGVGLTAREAFLARGFPVGDGRFVLWGEATVDDHRLRVDMLSKLRSGLDRTIALHVDAITAIKAAGVTCIYDIEAVAA